MPLGPCRLPSRLVCRGEFQDNERTRPLDQQVMRDRSLDGEATGGNFLYVICSPHTIIFSPNSLCCPIQAPSRPHPGIPNYLSLSIHPCFWPSSNAQVLSISAVTPATLSASGWTLVNVSTAGVDANCDDNAVIIGGIPCFVVACGQVRARSNTSSGSSRPLPVKSDDMPLGGHHRCQGLGVDDNLQERAPS